MVLPTIQNYVRASQYNDTQYHLFDVSPARRACLEKRVSLCGGPKINKSSCEWSPCRTCCQPGFVGGYNAFYPPYAPMKPDNAFFDRQDFPTGSFLPRVGFVPDNDPGRVPYGNSYCPPTLS